jgi:hypothetical protein
MTRTGRWKQPFLEALRVTGNISAAARAVGIRRAAVYDACLRCGTFSRQFEEAREDGWDNMMEEARRRALQGTPRLVMRKGVPVIDPKTGMPYVQRRYSDRLLMFLLRMYRPEKFVPEPRQQRTGRRRRG